MAGKDGFKYIINTSLNLNKGSLTKLLEDVKQVDRDIKAHFEKAGGGVKVPITVDKDISKFQGEVRRVVDGYNKGQAPSVKIKIAPDEKSISALQRRISEVKKQLQSLSDEQARVSVNTSLVVGRNEGEEVQKQVEGIKPTIEVKVIANEDSLKQMKAQIEAIKTEVQATVNTVQSANRGMNRVGSRPNRDSSVGSTSRNANRRINVPRGSAVDRFLNNRKELTDEINTIQNSIKLLEKEEKLALSANEIQSRIDKLTEAQSKGRSVWQPRNEKGVPIKGESQVKSDGFDSEIEKYKNLIKQADQLNSLKKDLANKLKQRNTLERTVAYKNTSKSKPTPRSNISPDSSLGQTLSEIEAKKKDEKTRQDALDKAEKQRQAEADKAEKKRQSDAEKAENKRQSDAEKARIKVQRDNERTLKRSQQVSYNRLNRGRGTAETQDRRMGYQQHLEDIPNRYVSLNETRANMQARVSQLKDLTGGYSNGKTGAEKRAQYSPQALAHVQSLIDKLNSDIKSLDNEINTERAKLQDHVNKLYGNDSQGRKLQQSLLGGNSKVNPNDVVKATVKTQTVANVKAENDAKLRAWNEQKAQDELEKQWSQTGAYSELPSNGRIAKLMARNQARQEYLNRKTQSVSQAKNDYDTHTRRYGGNREYRGTDLEAMLRDPNVNLQDSLSILKNKINPHNAQQAYQNKQGFQKAYSISYKDDEGNIRNIRTLTYEYTKLGETIERGDKGFTAMLSHIGTKVGVFSLLEGAMFGVIGAVVKGVEDMAKFDAQLAEVVATTKDLNSEGNKLQSFYSQGQNGISGTSSMESQVQNDTFKNAETYGVSALSTVMPIEQQVIARHNLVSGNGGYDSNMKDQIVQKIMQFSAISTGGEATPEETNDLTKDSLSLYQAYYNPDDPNQHIDKMNSLFDNLTSMRMRGVNTTAVTDAMAELAPDTLTAGIDSNQVISALGAYNLSDASASGDDIQTIGRTFFGALRHANTNDNLKSSLQQYMGIDLTSQTMSAPDLLNKIIQTFPTLNDAQQEQFAQAFAGTSGKGTAMTPKMVKLLQSFGGADYNNFMKNDANGNNQGAMDKSWLPFSDRLKTNFDNLVEKLQEFTQLLGRLGVLDSLRVLVSGFNMILDAINSLLRGVQKLSDFFSNNNMLNIPKITLEILTLQGAVKGIVALTNKLKFGGAIGDLLAGNIITRGMGVRTTAQRIGLGETAVGETMGTIGPMVNINRNTSNDVSKVVSESAGNAEKVATQTSEKATQSAINVMRTSTLKNSADSMLKDVLTFTTADVLANKLKRNPAVGTITEAIDSSAVKSVPRNVSPFLGELSSSSTLLNEAIAKSATKSTGAKVMDSVGGFMSDMLFIGALKGKGKAVATVAEDGVAVASKAGPLAKFGDILMGMLPALRTFGLLLGRLSLVGAVAYGAYQVYDAYQKHQAKVYKQQTINAKGNFKELGKDSSFKHATINNVDNWLKLNAEPLGQGHDMLKTKQLNDKMAKDWNLQYHGQGKNATISYVDAKGDKKTARVDNKDGSLTQFKDLYKNNGLTDVQKLSDAWKVSTDSMTDYANELTMIDVLSKSIAVTMNNISTGQKQIDSMYGGITSSGSLDAKIAIAKKGLSDSKDQGDKLQAHATDINLEYQRSTNSYNKQVKKAIGTNLVSQSDIEEATTSLEVAKAGGKDINAIIDNYKGLDATDSKDMKKIQSLGFANKNGKVTDKQGLEDYNTKQQAINSVLAKYQQYSASSDLNAQSQDALNQYKEQKAQYEESVKQMTAQSMIAKLGLDALSASLQQLGAVASASKTLVDMNENVLNTGDNSAQIGALHSSMQVSTSQMNGMLSQQNIIQSAMDKLKKDNPNQDFSLNTLYDPKDPNGVSPEQMAYKSLYEQSNQMTQNIASQSSAMYAQVQQLRDLVLNSTEYADSWQRIQQTVQDVKDAIKSTNDFQYQMSTLNENALTTSAVTGQKLGDVKGQQLNSLRDSSLALTTKITTDSASFNNDISTLNKAWQDILQQEGTNFKDAMIDPLKGIVGNFGSAVTDFGKDVSANNTNMQDAVNKINQAVSNVQAQAQSATLNSASQSSSGTGSYGAVSNTGQTIKSGQFAEKDYASMLTPVAGGVLKDNVGAVVQAAGKYGIPPELVMAVAQAETSGTSNLAVNHNNFGGIKASGSSPEWGGGTYSASSGTYRTYSSVQQGLNDLAYVLSQKISQGYNTIPLLNAHYAQSPYWMNTVAGIMGKETGTSASTWLGDASASSGMHLAGNDGGDPNYTGVVGGGSSGGGGGSSYSGTSIVDYLKSIGQDTSFSHRQSLASQHGISGYSGTASQNTALLNAMRSSGGGSSAPASSSAPAGGGVANMFSWYNSVLGKQAGQGGISYAWGGAHAEESWNTFISKAAADCSGLVEQVYKQFAGIDLGTTSSAGLYSQNDGGQQVSRNQLQPGDLVFYGTTASNIHHVGVYAGNNEMYTIDHSGMPVTKETLWSDYYGAKHYNIPQGNGATPGSPQASAPSQIDQLVADTNKYHDGITAEIGSVGNVIPTMQQSIYDDLGKTIINGNIADVMGTTGRIGWQDKIIQARQDIGSKMLDNQDQINLLNVKHDSIVDNLNNAYNSGDAPSYNEYHAQLAYTDQLIKALQDNTSQLQTLDEAYKAQQGLDPRTALGPAHDYIVGGLNQLKSYDSSGQMMGVDYIRTVNEVNNMKSQYLDHQKEAQSLGTLFDNYGSESTALGMTKSWADQDNINLLFTQINNINGVLKGFAEGTQQWYSVLNESAQVEQKLHDLEQQRLTDAKTMFTLTGQGLQSYIQQKAYTQSKDYSQNSTNLQSAIIQYQNGATPAQNGYGIQMPSWDSGDGGRSSAQSVSSYLTGKYGYNTSVVNAEGGWTVRGDANLSKDQASTIFNDLYGSKIGAGWVTGGGYGIQMPSWYGDQSSGNASTVQKYIQDTWGYNMQMKAVTDGNNSGYTLTGQDNLTQQNATDIFNDIMGKYIGAGWVKTPNMYDTSKSYGVSTQNFSDQNGEDSYSAMHYLGQWTGTHPNWVQDQQGGGHWQANNMTSEQANNIDSMLNEFKLSSGNTITSSMDFNQQLANLQTIADTHNTMTQQMNDYKQAVIDAFKAGAMSIDDYISKLNQLRDVQTEQKENAVSMVGNVQSGFSSALSDALTQGMQGSINSPLDFMNSIKSTLSSSISGQLTSTLLNNTGLQDVMNKISTSVATASTSGNPNDIVNMFNNNDFGKQMQDAIAPFLPMIQQLVGSTKGIFTILKDQVFNAPSGFKIDKYMNEISNSVGYQGIKAMNPNVNGVGSPTLTFDDSGNQIQTTAPSQVPTGVPTTTSGTGATATGAPENTTGTSTGAPDSSAYTNAPAVSNKPWQSSAPTPPPPPPAPAPASTSTYTVKSGDTLSGIGAKLGVSWTSIASLNGISSPYRIYPGEVLKISGGSSGGGGGSSSSGSKHTSSALYFHSSPSYGNNVMGTIPKGAGVSYYGLVSGWAKVGYNGKTGYVGPSYLYHTGGIAGVTNFASGQGLKPNELSAILQKSETVFQPKQLDDLVNGAMQSGANSNSSSSGVNINVTVNFSGDTSDKGTIEQTVNTAVQKALQEFKKTTRLNNLSWKGTSY